MNARIKRLVVTMVVLIMAISGLAIFWRPPMLFNRGQFSLGNEVVSRVEKFRAREGRLPSNLSDLGFNETDMDVFYRPIDEQDYQVWFGTTLGESEVYDSRQKKWK